MKKRNHKIFWRGYTIFRVFFRLIFDYVWEMVQRIFRGYGVMEQLRPALYRRQAIKLRETAILLGGVWVKLGQFFSTRVDLLPREYTEELSKLQNEVPSEDVNGIIQVVEAEFGRPLETIFSTFDRQVLAAASLGQVHLAVLPSGEKVAVKVLRPEIEAIIDGDLKTLQRLIVFLQIFTSWGRRFDLTALYQEFSISLLAELDYLQEGKNCERFAANLADEAGLKIPQVYWTYTTQRVLTLEYVEGYKITEIELWEKYSTPALIVPLLVKVFIRQILDHGFFHGDPHPGNILVLPDGRLGLIDFGLVGEVTTGDKAGLRELILALATKNTPGMVKAFLELGFLRPETDLVVVRRALDRILERVYDMPLNRFTNEQWMEIMREFEEVVRDEPFQIPATFVVLGRTVGTLFGLCVHLEPNTPFVELLEPHLKRLALAGDAPSSDPWHHYHQKLLVFLGSMGEIPGLLQRTLTLAEQGNLHIKVDSHTLAHILRSQEKAIRFLGRSIVFAAFLLTAVAMYLNEKAFEAHFYLVLALFVGLFLLFGWFSYDKFNRR